MWFGYTVACSLYALGFAGYFWEFFLQYLPSVSQSVFGLADEHGAALILTIMAGVVFTRLDVPGQAASSFPPFLPDGMGGSWLRWA